MKVAYNEEDVDDQRISDVLCDLRSSLKVKHVPADKNVLRRGKNREQDIQDGYKMNYTPTL